MRKEIYKTLTETDGFVSGEVLSATLGISRAALWKHIKAMQADGAIIESVTGMGYQLISPPKVARTEYLAAHMLSDVPVFYKKSVTSTNDIAKQAAQTQELVSAVFVAGEQTAGKGRKGRSWLSRSGEGVYMSFLVRPDIDMALISGLTLMASVKLCEAIEAAADISAKIKWPNDIIVGGKKAAGILTESMLGMEGIEYVVCGMGINTGASRFEDELKDTATSLGEKKPINNMLFAASVIDAFLRGYQTFLQNGLAAFMPQFRARSAISGTVTVLSPGGAVTGTLLGFDDTGAILLGCDGETKSFVAGEVSLRGENGYV